MAPQPQAQEPIAIVGSACRFPGRANSPSALWDLLQKPRDLCQNIPKDRFDTAGFYHPDGAHHGTTNVQHSYLLEEDVRVFDAAFFNISPNEADSIDPQQRILLETVYEALERGGHTLESLQGSDTAVFTGTMSVDYTDTGIRDLETIPKYFATGTNRAIISNRVSYTFDWRGPSMTIDTACSSSLVAVHQGVKAIRTGESRVAVACGTQVILNPETFIIESKLNMLSPTGRSRMWDADADGYARGEGVAAVIMKRLSDAIADGDHIESIIRETGSNQDGHTSGITVPSTEAQAALIRQTYARAGLDPENNPLDRPQYFEAHGTGTKAGDPKEAAAIYQSFGKHIAPTATPLYVGSIKTVIGHLEGAAGLAGLLKASRSIQHGYIPPNLLFNTLNPTIEPFYKGLHVPTKLLPWPQLPESVPKRVSVNSFGFGGSNAHAILEEYIPSASDPHSLNSSHDQPSTPFVFSAASESSLLAQLESYSEYLKTNNDINAIDLAWTLQSRRSQLSTKAAFSALTLQQLALKIDAKLASVKENSGSTVGLRCSSKSSMTAPRLLGIFTGQGAQWPAMGAALIRTSPFVRQMIKEMEDSLAALPPNDRPTWSLKEEMLAGPDSSRIAEAALSQPLCTAVQVVLVELLKKAGISFSAVVGHSSGEIAAAYAAGFFSATDSIRIAYYRGLYAKLAGSEKTNQKGAMLAVGTSWDDAQELTDLRAFKGRLAIAAHNSSASVTLSGDADAVIHANKVFTEEKKFARLLKVDTAYHSHHMLPCGDPYIKALRACGVTVNRNGGSSSCDWYSSVYPSGEPMRPSKDLEDIYWRDNMTKAVLFTDAVRNAVTANPEIQLVMEVGPHPALKGPATQTIGEIITAPVPYCGVLSRGQNDVESFSEFLGFVWTNLSQLVNFDALQQALIPNQRRPKLVTELPTYRWNHGRVHWSESRRSRKMRERSKSSHEVLGVLLPESTPYDMRWSNVLKPSEISWLEGHQLQGQLVFPAAGYVAMALQASKIVAADKQVELFELLHLNLPRAITFEGENAGAETLVTLTKIRYHADQTCTADFCCYSLPVVNTGSKQEMDLMASGSVRIVFGTPSIDALSCKPVEDYNMYPVDSEVFYDSLIKLGYGYTGPFKTLRSARRRLGHSIGLIDSYAYADTDTSTYLIHPSTLDVAFQASILAYSGPLDEHLWSLHVPTAIGGIRINPEVCALQPSSGCPVPVHSVLPNASETFSGSIDLYSEDGQYGMVQVEDLIIKPFGPATKHDDRVVYTHTKFKPAAPDGKAITEGMQPSSYEVDLGSVCERLCFYYIQKWNSELIDADWKKGPAHFWHLRNWVKHSLDMISAKPSAKSWSQDGQEEIAAAVARYKDTIDVKMITAVGEKIPASARGETTILEHMVKDDMLNQYYKKCLGAQVANGQLADMMKQISHRYPHAKILEIGAGTGGATKAVLETMGDVMSSYTFTDISVGFFEHAQKLFNAHQDKMVFKTLDVEKSPSAQGYEPQSYDIIIASNVLHATASLQTTLTNTRQLLRPGGYLLLLELTTPSQLRSSMVFGSLPGWWLGVDDGRKLAPIITPGAWHSALRKAGFSGVDTITPEINPVTWPAAVFATQAIDDKVSFLRRPLAASPSSPQVQIESLVILGNGSLETSQVAEELSDLLGKFCDEVTILDGLPTESEAAAFNPISTFINLVDLESPIFKNITEAKMEGLKRVFDFAKNLLWITQGALADDPYHMASIAFSRVIRAEATHINLNVLDVSDMKIQDASKPIAELLLQLVALDAWGSSQQGQQKLLWSREPETFLQRRTLKIPRLLKNLDQNARLNSLRRVVTKEVYSGEANIAITWPQDAPFPSLVDYGPRITPKEDLNGPVRVESSSLMALTIFTDTSLFLAVGTENATKRRVIALSTENASEISPIASANTPSTTKVSSGSILIAVASELFAEILLRVLSAENNLLIYSSGKDRILLATLSRHAAAKSIRITFVIDGDKHEEPTDTTWLRLSTRMSQHHIRKALHQIKPTHFIDLASAFSSTPDELSIRVTQAVQPVCKQISSSDIFQKSSSLPTSTDRTALSSCLEDAVRNANSVPLGKENVQDMLIPLTNTATAQSSALSAVTWPADEVVKAEVRPLDNRRLFSKDRTYVLAGLSGKLGQSICEWMIDSGAGCVVLTSRRPDIDDRWLSQFQGTVKIFSMDVTDSEIVNDVVKSIKTSCFPVAGVVHGAMVLHDSLFQRLSTSKMQQILGPKVDGANNLEAAFHDDKLDFFIMLSSVSMILGNAGQSLYAAGNGYLNGLARQRRRRGLAASTLDIGRVVGIGYVEAAAQIVRDQLIGLGLRAINESDLRHMFAESIQAGFPSAEDVDRIPEAVLSTGIREFGEDENVKGPWFTNSLFSHMVIEKNTLEASSTDPSNKAALPVGQQLELASTQDQVFEILVDCFSAKLGVILQSGDQEIDRDVPLVELGIDSLVAVEVRSWFLKELQVDIPVLKVIGGASPADLCQAAMEKLPEKFLAGTTGNKPAAPTTNGAASAKAPSAPAATPAKLRAQQNGAESSSIASSENGAVFSSSGRESPSTAMSSTSPSPPVELISDLEAKPAAVISEKTPPSAPKEKLVHQRFLKTAPISFGQSRFWFLHHLLEDQNTHNVAYYYHISGNLHVSSLERAVRLVATRHESLRTCFVANSTDPAQADQKILSSSSIKLEYKRIHSLEEVDIEYAKLRKHEFDMASGELLRIALLTLTPSSHYLLMYHHHIIMDGVSLQVFLSDLEKAYNGESLGQPPRQYSDFSVAQRDAYDKGEMSKELNYWRGVFPADGQPPVLPLLPMARVSTRKPMQKFDTHQVEFRLEPELAMRVRSVAKASRSTPFHLYLAATKAMLFSFTECEDLVIGVADAARNDENIMGSIGFFLNLLPLRFRRRSDQSFNDAVSEARDISYAALANSRLPFDVLLAELNVARSSSYSPFFQAFVDYRQGAQAKHPFGDCEFEIGKIDTGKTAYDVTVDVTDSAADALIMIRAQKSLYDLAGTQLLSETFVHFLKILTAEPSLPLSKIPLFSETQRAKAAQVGRGPRLLSDWPETLPHRIDQIAELNPDKIALMDDFRGNGLTYSEMTDRIESIAEALQKAGVIDGDRVLVFQQATADWVCSMLAIMRVGGTYVPLDLRNPLPRLATVAKNCEPKAILTDSDTGIDVPKLEVDTNVVNVTTLNIKASAPVPNVAKAGSVAAILYTSGSTGTAKGIAVKHSGLRNEIEGYTKRWELGAERTLQQSAFTFNHSSDQIYTGLSNGGMVYIVPWSKRGNPLEITDIIQRYNITYTKATPSEYLLWMQYGGDKLRQASSWRCAFGGGETMTPIHTQEFAALDLPQLRVFNSFGPTEISISSTKMEIPYRDQEAVEAFGRIPCGFSLPNYSTFVIDEQLRPLPVGMPGELCISGAGVSNGYFKDKALTDQHFVPMPFASPEDIANGWTTLYRTGDIGHLNEDGTMVFHNRIAGDTQVKIRGIRIELSDIEEIIIAAAAGALVEAVVTLRQGDPEYLVAHAVFSPTHNVSDKEIFLERLLRSLPVPQYMVPVVVIPLEVLPLTNHSKTDRKAIQNMPLPRRNKPVNVEVEMTETMVQLKTIWREVLGETIETLGLEIVPETNFFFVGGNSLLVIRLQDRIRRAFNVAIPLVELLSANTLGVMARIVEESSTVKLINWEQETTPLSIPDFLRNSSMGSQSDGQKKTVLITGGTGFLAKHLLPQLNDSPEVGTIHVLAVRNNTGDNPRELAAFSKITYHNGNLSWPLLGLSQADFHTLSSNADTIIHLGGSRSFWDSYSVLRPSNVLPVKELVKLAAPRRVPIHYISSVGVLPRSGDVHAVSAAANIPAADGSNGYNATRWASERILERSQETYGVPAKIYRFIPALEQKPSAASVLEDFVQWVDATGLLPDSGGWDGRLDMIPAQDAARSLCASLNERSQDTSFVHYECPITITMEELISHVEQHRGDRGLERIPFLKWVGRIKKLGFKYLLASHEATVSGGVNGEKGVLFESRR